MADRTPEPIEVVSLVEEYVRGELHAAREYSNRKPLDEPGIWSLHEVASAIYALGWRAGERAAAERAAAERLRERDARRELAEPSAKTTKREERGLYGKYRVERLNDPERKHAECRYFVLDPQHDPIARDAIELYATRAGRIGHTELEVDLGEWLKSLPAIGGEADRG